MSNVSIHQNPSELSKAPHKIIINNNNNNNNNNKHSLVKTKPTKRSPRSNKNKFNNINNNNNNTNNNTNNNINKPLKVVHISNPMKFEATPTEFRDLVHKLTGRDAVVEDWSYDYNHRVNHQDTVAVSNVGDGSSCYDQVVQEVHQDNVNQNDDEAADVTSFPGCFGPSDHLSFDYSFGTFQHGYIDDDFSAFMDDN